MFRVLNQPPANSIDWVVNLHLPEEDSSYELPSSEFGMAVGSTKDDPIYCLQPFRGCRLAISVCEDLPSDFDFMEFLTKWFKAAKLNNIQRFFIQLTRIPESGEGFPDLITVDQSGEIFSQEFRAMIPYPHAQE